MSDLNNLDDIFDDDFDLEQQATVTIDNIDQELLEDDEEEGLNRTFMFAGMSLFGTFAAIVAAIVLLSSGGEDTTAIETAAAIETFNAQQFTEAAETAVAIEDLSTLSAEETATSAANITSTALAEAEATEDTRNTQVAATVTQIAIAATQTQFANQTAIVAELTANAPTAAPTVSFRFEIRDSDGNPIPGGSVITVFQDDGDRELDPRITPTPPPSATPTLGPTSTPEPVDVPEETPEQDATAVAATLEAQISEFDQLATQRAEEAANATRVPAPSNTPEPVEEPETSEEPTPVADDVQPISEGTVSITAGTTGVFSIDLPSTWLVEDDLDADAAELRFGDSEDFIAAVSSGDSPLATDIGTGGLISALFGQEADDLTLDIFQGAFTDSFAEEGIEFVEPITPYSHPTLEQARLGVIRGAAQQGYVALLGRDTTLLLVLVATGTDDFNTQQAQLLGIIDSIEIPAAGVSAIPLPPEAQVIFMSYRPDRARSDPQQGDGTPAPDGDEPGIPISIQPDGTGTIVLPGEPGTYFLVLEFPPGTYTLFIEEQIIDFTVIQGEFTESVVILADRTLILRSFGLDPQAPTPTETPSPTPTLEIPLQDTPISPFLQTATANARTLPEITATVVVTITPSASPTALPETGLFFDDDAATSDGLTMLALMGVGLLGIVFIVRRLRSSIES